MNAATQPAGRRARPVPAELKPGDVVTRKPGLVVLGPVWSVPALYVARDAEGRYHVLHRAEVATVERPEPLTVTDRAAAPVDDWRDSPAPALAVLDAEPVELPEIDWAPESSTGETISKEPPLRFMVRQYGQFFDAYDTDERESAHGFALRDDAVEWCQRQLAFTNAARRLEADIEAAANPGAEPVAAPAKPPGLSWEPEGKHCWESACGRFRVVPAVGHLNGTGEPTLFNAVDTRAQFPELRTSPSASVEACKAWCDERRHFDVRLEFGDERLVRVLDEGGEVIPF